MNTFDFTEINNLIKKCYNNIEQGHLRIININGHNLIVYENGDIYRITKDGHLRSAPGYEGSLGYNKLMIHDKRFLRHQIIAKAFLNLDIDDQEQQIEHIDGNINNNHLNNLKIVNVFDMNVIIDAAAGINPKAELMTAIRKSTEIIE